MCLLIFFQYGLLILVVLLKKFLARQMPFCVSWMGADPVEGAAASSQEQEQQLHPWSIRRGLQCSGSSEGKRVLWVV